MVGIGRLRIAICVNQDLAISKLEERLRAAGHVLPCPSEPEAARRTDDRKALAECMREVRSEPDEKTVVAGAMGAAVSIEARPARRSPGSEDGARGSDCLSLRKGVAWPQTEIEPQTEASAVAGWMASFPER